MNNANVTKYSYEESNARMARGVCVSTRRIGPGHEDVEFYCNGTIPADHLAEGYGCCQKCEDQEWENYQHCESADARRFEEMSY